MQRKLAAIMSAEVVGYSRLMETDEVDTLVRLQSTRDNMIDPKIAAHNGRVVKLMGDGELIEFPSVVDAVRCAVEIQQAMAECNEELPADKRLEFRIGVNLGDVILEGQDIYGDGVNVAARLEELADPGGVLISGTAFDHVERKLDYAFDFVGEQQVKNIEKPVRLYRIRLGDYPRTTAAKARARRHRPWIDFDGPGQERASRPRFPQRLRRERAPANKRVVGLEIGDPALRKRSCRSARALITLPTTSSCRAKISARSRSRRSAQRQLALEASMSCALIRPVLPPF